MQIIDFELNEGESIFTESGGMSWMSENISMKAGTKGGVVAGVGRMLAGESLFLTTYTCDAGTGVVSFASEYPGKIITIQLKEGESVICQKDAFMCAQSTVKLELYFKKKLVAGFFGGEGFILQKITGPGTAFFEISGEVTEYALEKDQTFKIDPGHIAMFEPKVNYDITTVKGIRNILFAGEGLFLATLTGPGKIWLQSMPISNLAAKLSKYMLGRR